MTPLRRSAHLLLAGLAVTCALVAEAGTWVLAHDPESASSASVFGYVTMGALLCLGVASALATARPREGVPSAGWIGRLLTFRVVVVIAYQALRFVLDGMVGHGADGQPVYLLGGRDHLEGRPATEHAVVAQQLGVIRCFASVISLLGFVSLRRLFR